MNKKTRLLSSLGSLPLVLLLAGGCASQKTLKQYQDEVRSLREERTQLKKENRDLRAQAESYEAALVAANTKAAAVPEGKTYDELDALGVEYGQRDGNFYVSIPSTITFDSGKAELTKQGREALKTVASTLMRDHAGGTFWIEGHTDTDPIKTSGWPSNRDLSVARAMAVLHFLVEDCDVPDDSCVVAGHGQYEPISSNEDKAGKARNRRVEIVVHREPAIPASVRRESGSK
jgi:chemotaxis protein MotB